MTAAVAGVPAVELRSLHKSYVEGTAVLRDVDLVIARGTITALVGANGSGKSTLVRILSGYHEADAGSEILIDGYDVGAHVTPKAVRDAGLRFVHQDSGLVAGLSVVDNMLVGRYRSGFGGHILWKQERESIRSLLARWSIDADLDADAGDLSLATIAKLAVLRALQSREGERITAIILDEPTAALGQDDAAELLHWLRDLATNQNVGVLFISHRLDEIFAAADQVAVLRSGRIVALRPVGAFDHASLVEAIIGTKLDRFYPERQESPSDEVRLSVRGLAGGRLNDASFELRRGEVVGVTGLPGSGFEDIPYLLGDPTIGAAGATVLDGEPLDLRGATIDERIRRGLVLIPGDRKRKALVTDLTVRENLTVARFGDFVRRGRLHRGREIAEADSLIAAYGIKTFSSDSATSQLSGGNQQKVVLAKWLSMTPAVILVHEPTHGVDIGAKSEIFSLIVDSAAAGMAALVASVEYDDLAHLCDRVLVFADGRVCAELTGDRLTPEAITAAAFYGASQAA
ncbi:sugar ABC transporter ATP-binding protein [uncultured Amnibacterium sp.]|uniref:sugar ABC transporter ATP-binding protein n=1 Tax=uncultured Amnibacterium sp. TaxID=1631851 RepID=UPI0035CA2353